MARYWLGPWVWESGIMPCWRMPAGATSSIDLRSVQQCAVAGGAPQGVGLFVSPTLTNLGSDYTNLGTDPEAVLSGVQKSALRTLLALPNALAANTLHDAIWEALTIQSDPTGDDRAPPIVPTVGRRYELWLEGGLRKSIKFRGDELEAAPVLDMLKRQYRQHRLDSIKGRTPAILYRKILGYWCRKYGLNYRAFQPADVPDEADIEPTTTITESFNTADSDTLGPDLSWTELAGDIDIVSNQARSTTIGSQVLARANSDLSSADHYSQAVIGASSEAAAATTSTIARKDSTATLTFYLFHNDWGGNVCLLFKSVAGVYTQIGSSVATTLIAGTTYTSRGTCNGSSMSHSIDGSNRYTYTDSAISSGTRCGIRGDKTTSGYVYWDSFEAADLVTRGIPFGTRGTAFNGGRALTGLIR